MGPSGCLLVGVITTGVIGYGAMLLKVVCVAMIVRVLMFMRHRLGSGNLGMVMLSHAEKHGRGSKPLHRYGKGKQAHENDAQGLEHFSSVSEAIR